jgi:two-component system, OmpR family, response regulator
MLLRSATTGFEPGHGPPSCCLPRVNPALHIAVVDDEPDITLLLANYLQAQGYRVTPLHNGASLMALMPQDPPALVLLDLGLPGEDGFSIARQLREHWRCGLVIVTGRGDAVDKVVGLEVGADDYVTKPFDLRELLARIKAVLRRLSPAEASPPVPAPLSPQPVIASPAPRVRLRFEGWEIDTAARRLSNPQGQDVPLTGGEFDLLCAFAQHPGRVLSRDFLLGQTRNREAGPFDRTIDVQVGRLRRKMEADPEDPRLIRSVRGAGYLFVPNVVAL